MASESQGNVPICRDQGPSQKRGSQSCLTSGQDPDGRFTSPSCESFQAKINDLKYYLEGWREILIQVHHILIWKRAFAPLILWAIISLFFGIVHYGHFSALTTLAALGIFIVISDYLVPILQSHVFDPNLWSGTKERNYEAACEGIICIQDQFYGMLAAMAALKRSRPSIYFLTVLSSLFFIAWLGCLMDNLLLTYILVCFLIMLPGVIHRGYLQRFVAYGTSYRACKKRD